MIIGFDGSRAFVGQRTGTENYSYQLLKALAKIDKSNKYIVYLRPQSVIARSEATKQSSKVKRLLRYARNDESGWPDNFQFKKIPWPRLWTQGGLALQTFKEKMDVLFVPAHTLPIIKRPGLKTAVTVHDLGSEYLPNMHQLKQRLYLDFMQKYQLKTATKIIAVSKATKMDLMERIGIEDKKIKVVYEGFDQKLFKPAVLDTQVNSLIPYFLFVGTVQPRKNLERIIKAFSVIASPADGGVNSAKQSPNNDGIASSPAAPRNDEVKLVIVGSKGWLSDEIYKLPKKLGIEDRVKFLGYVPDEKLPALYCGALAFVFPSLFEGFGLPIIEAQACGCPVITSNVSSMPEVSGKGAILVDPYSARDIASGMINVMDKEVRNKLIKKGFENIKRFSWEKCARESLDVLEEV